ncbi:MAG: diguanylate cyclase [Roseibium sp.]|uniref:diguanylate cyclase n=1 Tax=Roseibium sp. TaxID=1936156 RepID=UPI00261B8970|nr:diguanylate cyclase [Roseibium sp.]MCV0424019.1 diguanylate cyclase [Roseibium sp.]
MRMRPVFRYTITGKLLTIVAICVAFVVAASGVGIYQIRKIGQEIEFIAEAEVPLTEAIGHVTAHRLEQTALIERLMRLSLSRTLGYSLQEEGGAAKLEGRFLYLGGKITDEFAEASEIAEQGIEMARSQAQIDEFEAVLKTITAIGEEHLEYTERANQVLVQAKLGNPREAEQLLQDVSKKHTAFNMELEALLFRVQALAETAAKSAAVHEKNAIRFTVMISLGAAALSVLLAMWLGRRAIAFPLLDVVNALRRLSRNDFDAELPVNRHDEIGDIGRAFKAFKQHLINVQEQEQVEKRRQAALTREIRLLSELNEWLQSSSSLEELFNMVSRFMTKLLPRSAGAVYVYSNSRDVLDGACSWNGGNLEAHIRPTSCWGLRRGRPYVFGDSEVSFACEHVSPGKEDGVYLCLPILAHGETVGLMHLTPAEDVGEEEFLKDRKLAQMAAEQVSLAIANTRMRDELHNQSIRDPLTGLFNRRHFIELLRNNLERARYNGQSVSLVSIDVDHFKKFNDNHGHDAGDMVLRAVGAVMEQVCEGDQVPCRLGGEEFMVLLPAEKTDEAAEVAEKLRDAVAKVVVRYGEKNLPKITVSCGVAGYPDHGRMPLDLMKSADDALYKSKDGGRNLVTVASCHDDEEPASDLKAMLEDAKSETVSKADETKSDELEPGSKSVNAA